jgi:tetratricopeptide (TPR) repeat protein
MSQDATPARHAAEHESDENFKRFVAFLLTTMIIVAAVVTVLQTRAGARASRWSREAQAYALRAMGLKTSGQAVVDYGWQGAYQQWEELDDLSLRAELDDRAAEAARYSRARDRLNELTPLLNPPYFDPLGDSRPDQSKFEAETYLVETTALSEHYTDAASQNEAWDSKARSFTTHLTLLAVTLSLYGLSTTITGRIVRWLFVGAGTVIAAFTLLWLLIVALWPIPRLADEAIQAYAEGVGLAWQGGDENNQLAIEKFTEALNLEPDYGNAYYERGNAYYDLEDYESAVADFRAAQAAGKDDTNVGWNLGWTLYLMGRFDEAIEMDRHTLDLDPDLVGVRTNLALALLVSGRTQEARHEYQNAMDTATRLVTEARAEGREPPASLWWYLDAGSIDLDNLLNALDGQPREWTEAPPPESVADPQAVKEAANEFIASLKNLTAALEYTSQPPPVAAVAAVISPFEFGQERPGAGDVFDTATSFPYETDRVVVLFDYDGMQDGQQVIWKIYHDGFEANDLRVVETWDDGEAGRAGKPISFAHSSFFIFSPGEYRVEMFVDYHLVQRGAFIIRDTEGATPLKTSGDSGDILFEDDFSSPYSGWTTREADDYTIRYADGSYRFNLQADGTTVWGRPRLDLTDVSIEVDVTKFSGPDTLIGVICRYVDSDNFYLLEIADTGVFAIYKLKDGKWGDPPIVAFDQSEAIQTGNAANHLRADCSGSTFTLYVNGEKVAEGYDPDFASGDVGLLVGSFDQGGIEVEFDNFVIRQP